MNNSITIPNEGCAPRAAFNLALIGLTTMMAILFLISATIIDPSVFAEGSMNTYAIAALIASVVAIVITHKTKNTWTALIASAVVPVVLGALASARIQQMDAGVATESALLLSGLAAVMWVLSSMFSVFFKRIIGVLTISLIALIVVGILGMFIFEINMTMYHIASLVIFSGMLGYDFVRARESEPTLRNAIALSLSLFLDLINLYFSITSLTGD